MTAGSSLEDCRDLVVAEDRYVAADAVDLVEVEYEELPVLVDPTKSMAADAPILRD